jgi:hypothetical protein
VTALTSVAAGDDTVPGRPARPGGAAYWARIAAIVDQAPPLSDEQRCTIRLAIHNLSGTGTRKAAAA